MYYKQKKNASNTSNHFGSIHFYMNRLNGIQSHHSIQSYPGLRCFKELTNRFAFTTASSTGKSGYCGGWLSSVSLREAFHQFAERAFQALCASSWQSRGGMAHKEHLAWWRRRTTLISGCCSHSSSFTITMYLPHHQTELQDWDSAQITHQQNNMDRVWDTYKHHPNLSGSIFKVKVIQCHEVKKRSNWNFIPGWHDTCFYVSFLS